MLVLYRQYIKYDDVWHYVWTDKEDTTFKESYLTFNEKGKFDRVIRKTRFNKLGFEEAPILEMWEKLEKTNSKFKKLYFEELKKHQVTVD